jgi:hypothetical protein
MRPPHRRAAARWFIGAYYASVLAVMGPLVLVRVAQGSHPTPHPRRKPLTVDRPAPTAPSTAPAPSQSGSPVPVIQQSAPRARESAPVTTYKPTGVQLDSSAGSTLTVRSTAYCETGPMASGPPTYWGAVAMAEPFGTLWRVLSGPLAGGVFTAADHYGWGTQFDVAMPGECDRARVYGLQVIQIQRVG